VNRRAGRAGEPGGNVGITISTALKRSKKRNSPKPGVSGRSDDPSATIDTAGITTVDFKVETLDATPVSVTDVPSVSANIAKLEPKATGEAWNKWVPYIYRKESITTAGYPMPVGTETDQGTSENKGTFTNNGDGTYRYVFVTPILTVTTPLGKTVTYDPAKTHRVSIMMGGHNGPTATATYDFVPSGGAITETRDIVQTATCKNCHGTEFHGHGGNRLNRKRHLPQPGNIDPQRRDVTSR
jgi:OmcA/MtrC family decaheme c-type cytochrome